MVKILAIFACLGLAGCIAPPALTYASLAMDGASFLATGKSVGDHALSAARDEDCAVLRAVTEGTVEAVCRDYADDEARKDAIASTVVDAFKTANVEAAPEKLLSAPSGDTATMTPVADLASYKAPTSGLRNRAAIYLMIGNFSSQIGAEKLADRVDGLSTVISPALAGDSIYFRVAAGPIIPGETDAARSRLAAVGIGNSWAARLCTRDLGAPPCNN